MFLIFKTCLYIWEKSVIFRARYNAREGRGLDRLKEEISKRIAAMRHAVELVVPYDKGNVLSLIHAKGQVTAEEYLAEGTKVHCLLDSANYQRVLSMLR